ncbi:MAG: energy transducer TonB [Bacteroidales bacterium]|nr:energy transducer TonB [Bacteroidales bacterium]
MKKSLVKIGMLSFIMFAGYGLQAKESNVVNSKFDLQTSRKDSVYVICEKMAEFPGGVEAMYQFLSQTIKYPKQAIENKTAGKVFVTFVIEKDGTISKVAIIKGIGNGCDEEAIRVVKAMPKWKPATDKGKTVRQRYVLPINFVLPKNKK